jgi:integrase/recombinase XerD
LPGQSAACCVASPTEVEALLEACGQTRHRLRDRALVAFLYRTGALISEALDVRVPDVDLISNTVELRGTLKLQARTVGIDGPLHEELSNWLEERATLNLTDDWVFCRLSTHQGVQGDGQPMAFGTAKQLFIRLTRAAHLGETRVHPHAFRHTFAAELLGEGWPLTYIQRQLGLVHFRNIHTLLDNLDLPVPTDSEIIAAIHARPPDTS